MPFKQPSPCEVVGHIGDRYYELLYSLLEGSGWQGFFYFILLLGLVLCCRRFLGPFGLFCLFTLSLALLIFIFCFLWYILLGSFLYWLFWLLLDFSFLSFFLFFLFLYYLLFRCLISRCLILFDCGFLFGSSPFFLLRYDCLPFCIYFKHFSLSFHPFCNFINGFVDHLDKWFQWIFVEGMDLSQVWKEEVNKSTSGCGRSVQLRSFIDLGLCYFCHFYLLTNFYWNSLRIF